MTKKLVGLFTLATAAAGCVESVDTSTTEAPILGGSPATVGEFPDVVGVQIGGFICSGSIVAPDLVLVAAHCVDPTEVQLPDQQSVTQQTLVMVDTMDMSHPTSNNTYGAAMTKFDPVYGGPPDPNDVGLIWLGTPITDRAPSPVNLDPANVVTGLTITIVGYGVDGNGIAGKQNVLFDKATTACSTFGVSDDNFICNSKADGTGICQGDSGGPALAMINGKETIMGVASFGDGIDCQGSYSAHQRTDSAKSWLLQEAPELGCSSDGTCDEACGLNGLPTDPDCPTCSTDTDCATNQVCSDAHTCVPAPMTPGGLGAQCGPGHSACIVGTCSDGPDGKRCSQVCTTAADCGDGFDCLTSSGTGACWPTSTDSGGCVVGKNADGGAILIVGVMFGLMRRRRRQTTVSHS